ncbi:leucyl aminopeptidase family protein [Alicyclobacillus mengziensis]|uniref:Probable cytosol aminopeptidase n=1 Tax=Alicyclobacillus mengziensis TaxID=2931921 RepID=A0A9X7Z7H8_9BACL|nr:hypothetical protein [Alicyclobacillus mengziensis]QSO47238.1 hypothetical protein JZ786_23060 [Alicyclobacillus mengziensis]
MSQVHWHVWEAADSQASLCIVPVDEFAKFSEAMMEGTPITPPAVKSGAALLWAVPGIQWPVVLVNDEGRYQTAQRTWADAGKIIRDLHVEKVLVWLTNCEHHRISQAVFGLDAGLYDFKISDFYSNDVFDLMFNLEGTSPEHFQKCVEIAKGRTLARNWVNLPSNLKPPTVLANKFIEGSPENITWSIMNEAELLEQGAGGLLAVGQGSSNPSALLIGRYNGNGDAPYLGLVGKGITFDSGGLSLKPREGMLRMKVDMGGAAAVAAAVRVVAQLGLKVNVLAVIPLAENMTGSSAFRPGDVLTMLDGTTVEVISTDAEGRLALADAITIAMREGASHLIDVATLTGANVVCLGGIRAGVVTNNDAFARVVENAARFAMEPVWILPNDPEYMDLNRSGIADIKNSAGRPAGTITAGLFVGHFTHGVPWVHIDIAGMAYVEGKQSGTGATGYGVSLLVETCLQWSQNS